MSAGAFDKERLIHDRFDRVVARHDDTVAADCERVVRTGTAPAEDEGATAPTPTPTTTS